jgi:nitroimidazol reductase NimA-like FMN-containing flavoprotein (pyridoxamine 5'-phosphate oxidase superfamily)
MTANPGASARARIRRHPERARELPDGAVEVLMSGLVAHVAFSQDGQPFVLPFTYLYDGGHIYLHGAPASRTIRGLRSGMPVCIEVTLLDALVASRSAEYHSINYRSAVCFGVARVVQDRAKKRRVLETLIGRYFPGRTAGVDYAAITEKEFKATELIEVDIEEMSAKARTGGPMGPHDADEDALGNAGIVPLPRAGADA